ASLIRAVTDIGALSSAMARVRMALTEADSSKGKPMTTSLYDLSVPTFLQTVSAVAGFLDRAATHCAETGADCPAARNMDPRSGVHPREWTGSGCGFDRL